MAGQSPGSTSKDAKAAFIPGPSLATIFQSLDNIPMSPVKKPSPKRASPYGLNPAMLSTATVLAKESHGKIALKKSKKIMSNNANKSPSPNK